MMKWMFGRMISQAKPLVIIPPNLQRRRLEDQSLSLNETREGMKSKIRRQTDDLTHKDEQLKQGIDKQKRSEEQIHIRTKAMEATADGIFIIDALKPNFPFIYVNQSFQRMTGFSRREILGQSYFLHYGIYTNDPRV